MLDHGRRGRQAAPRLGRAPGLQRRLGPGDVPHEGDAQGITSGHVPSGIAPPDIDQMRSEAQEPIREASELLKGCSGGAGTGQVQDNFVSIHLFSCTEDLYPERFFRVNIRSESERRGGSLTPEVQQFMGVLRGFGFIFVEGAGRAFKNTRGAQLYYLVFASKSLTAATFWERISRDDEQPSLFS